MNLTTIKHFIVSEAIVATTEQTLRAAGRAGYEMFVLWSGRAEGSTFAFRTAHAPKQTSYKLEDGLAVKILGPELHRLNLWLLNHDEVLAAQVHAHPRDAYHSDTDDAYPIVTARGGLSLVAADFGRAGLLAPSSALYRLGDAGWDQVNDRDGILEVVAAAGEEIDAERVEGLGGVGGAEVDLDAAGLRGEWTMARSQRVGHDRRRQRRRWASWVDRIRGSR